MRNPLRLKNLRWRFAPLFALGLAGLLLVEPGRLRFASGAALALLGAGIRIWGAGHLVKNDRLTTSGPYAFVRHPLYVGSGLIGSGFALVIGGWLGALAWAGLIVWFALAYLPRKERVEAARLERLYGDAYRHYREQVPALLPRLRPYRAVPADGPRWSAVCFDGNNELGTTLAVAAGLAALTLRHFGLP